MAVFVGVQMLKKISWYIVLSFPQQQQDLIFLQLV
jgi:hypothetical protein